jgi:hypothetical protein
MLLHWDIFCRVVDNYGDIGVCWRLARQLGREHGQAVRLWVDDPASLAPLCPACDPALPVQFIEGVELRRWLPEFVVDRIADVVIEAFACELPAAYVAMMASAARQPCWINLEYLTAEAWAEGCHGLASPHPALPLTKHFFFPGFTPATGGLLREAGLLQYGSVKSGCLFSSGQSHECHNHWQAAFLTPSPPNPPLEGEGLQAPLFLAPSPSRGGLGWGWGNRSEFFSPLSPQPLSHKQERGFSADMLEISLFCYDTAPVADLLAALAASPRPALCHVPPGKPLAAVTAALGPADGWQLGQARIQPLPFLPLDDYDALLCRCAINFVRGEDSFVRAQWVGRPFVWQIYPQDDAAHHVKLDAFLDRYCAALPPAAASAVRNLFAAWNVGNSAGNSGSGDVKEAWLAFLAQMPEIARHNAEWARQLAGQPDLATNLVNFVASKV